MNLKRTVPSIFLLGMFLFLCPEYVLAARFFIVQDTSIKNVGDTVRGTLYLDTEGVAINNGEATVTFPKDTVTVQSISTSGSIFSLWIEQPSFSNENGTISFNGGIPNPGFLGQKGKVFDITLKAVAPGSGPLLLSNTTVLANDGLGTDVTTQPSNTNTVVTVREKITDTREVTPVLAVSPTQNKEVTTPSAPRITSKEIPNSTAWFNVKNATFSWTVPSGVTTVLTSLDTNQEGNPNKEYTPPISFKKVIDLDDGKQYLHVQFINSGGKSVVSTYPINIDTQAPKNLAITQRKPSEGGLQLALSATDSGSGISSYVITIDGIYTAKITEGVQAAVLYTLPALSEGDHTVNAQVFDKAGNSTESTIQVVTKLLPPTITTYPSSLVKGSPVTISGTSPYSASSLRLLVTEDNGKATQHTTKTGADGTFTFTLTDVQAENSIDLYAEMLVSDTEKSAPSNNVTISMTTSSTSLLIFGLIAILLLASLYILYIKVQLWKLRLEKSLDLTSVDIDNELESISIDIKNYIKVLRIATKRQTMSHEEEIELRTLFKQFTKAHSSLTKKLSKGARK